MQNSVNHRIVERTLRPVSPLMGHVRLRAVLYSSALHLGATLRANGLSFSLTCMHLVCEHWFIGVLCRSSLAFCRWLASARMCVQRLTDVQDADLRRRKFLNCGLRSSETHPLNLSISISGGRETNRDSLSNGERSGNKPRSEIFRPALLRSGELWSGEANCPDPLLLSPKLTWNGMPKRVRAP